MRGSLESPDVQMHHNAVKLRSLMPQANYLHHVGLMIADMEAAAKEGKNYVEFEDGTHGVDDMAGWVAGNQTSRASRIAKELARLDYDVRYKHIKPHTDPKLVMIVSW